MASSWGIRRFCDKPGTDPYLNDDSFISCPRIIGSLLYTPARRSRKDEEVGKPPNPKFVGSDAI
jgi:hypothetical protein